MQTQLMLYFRQSCHLCEQMLAELVALYGGDLPVRRVDVDSDVALKARYGLEVPVLAAGDEILSRGRLDREKIEEYLTRAERPGQPV